jgi:hypothetical protein
VRKYFTDGALEPHLANLSLIGRFKQVEGAYHHFLPEAVAGSGLQIREWVERLLKENNFRLLVFKEGWKFCPCG